jgi:DNA invertase Pin-like site-specific DNA recombinase
VPRRSATHHEGEREVIGEGVRDKIAASKRKGVWVGGPVPLGYRCIDKKLVVVPGEAGLTRSLADFAKLVELFDQHAVSFGSVTQSFNTTSSMGRLTLNVLLSFAQFQREVIGEREIPLRSRPRSTMSGRSVSMPFVQGGGLCSAPRQPKGSPKTSSPG